MHDGMVCKYDGMLQYGENMASQMHFVVAGCVCEHVSDAMDGWLDGILHLSVTQHPRKAVALELWAGDC